MLQSMLDDIAEEVRRTAPMIGRDRLTPEVMKAMAEVPRDTYVPPDGRQDSFATRALPTGNGQTIFQPYRVALMTALLEVQPGRRVLEIGTGCDYQAAVRACLAERVISVEVLPPLAQLRRPGYANV